MKTDWNLYGHGLDWANELLWPVQYKFTYQAKLHDQLLYQLPEPKLIPAPLKLPAQPKVDRVESTFHLLDSKNRLMCTGRYSTYVKSEVLSDRDSHTAVTRFQRFFCHECQLHLQAYAAA